MNDQLEVKNRIAELRKRKTNFPSFCGVLSTYAFVAGGIWVLRHHLNWWTGPGVFFLIGFMQYRMVMASHEAVHKNLFVPLWLNETMGLLNASLVGVSLFNYRRAHMEHHKAPQSIQDDIDGYIYRPLLLAKPGWQRLGLLVFGVFIDIYVKFKRKLFGDDSHPALGPTEPAKSSRLKQLLTQLGPIAAVQTTILLLFAFYVNWWSYFVFWFIPIFLIALSLDRARTFLEHGYHYFFPGPPVENLAQAPQSTIDVLTNPIERYLFAPFGFSYHQAHHAQLTVPFYNLPELTVLLEQNQPTYLQRVKGSYITILFKMLWAHK
jgi:fatty acid desaturase